MILLDQTDRRPIYEQITEKLAELMVRGILEENSPLPSVRNLAAELSINPNTVQRAYIELEREGYIYSVKGKGSFVASLDGIRHKRLNELTESLKSGISRAKAAGVTEEELIQTVRDIYSKGEQ